MINVSLTRVKSGKFSIGFSLIVSAVPRNLFSRYSLSISPNRSKLPLSTALLIWLRSLRCSSCSYLLLVFGTIPSGKIYLTVSASEYCKIFMAGLIFVDIIELPYDMLLQFSLNTCCYYKIQRTTSKLGMGCRQRGDYGYGPDGGWEGGERQSIGNQCVEGGQSVLRLTVSSSSPTSRRP